MVYSDTSALIKLYLDEPHSPEVIGLSRSGTIVVCRVTWAEAMAALARRARERPQEAALVENAKLNFARSWARLAIIEVSQSLVERAGEYADTFALRGYDAIQLAAAQELAIPLAVPLVFACFDSRLNKAARALGMQVPFA
jgi:predicted nucleic acid-binding protein